MDVPRRPIIGICTPLERARWGAWDDLVALVPMTYVDGVHRAGGMALLLPPDERSLTDPDETLDLVDALLLAGGVDVGPATYGAEPHPTTDPPVPRRDDFEIALAQRALARDMPFLGVCRGMQVLNVAVGGTLHQHVPELVGHEHHRHTKGVFSDHDVMLVEGSLAARAAGETTHPVKSHHHQAIAELGEGLTVTGWSADDELPEAVEAPDRRFALGVQWHPEADETSRLIAALVEEARQSL